MPSGAYVHADVYDWGMNIDAHVLGSDYRKTEGLCGNFDGIYSNELQHQDTDMEANPSDPDEIEQFVETWRSVIWH